MRSQIGLCLSLAAEAHAGQLDKAGMPYIGHAVRVALRCETDLQRCAALLHDVIEDTDTTAGDLRAAGVREEIISTVLVLTHGSGLDYDGYMDYIRMVATVPDARAVKMADLSDNMDLKRLGHVTPADEMRQAKYGDAYAILSEFA